MGLDSVANLHGRMFTICQELMARGHEIHAVITDYHPNKGSSHPTQKQPFTSTILPVNLTNFLTYLFSVRSIVDRWRPDLILAGSDALHIIAASLLTKKNCSVPFVADLKDNYESFGLTKLPFAKKLYISALQRSAGIICVSKPLRNHLAHQHGINKAVVLENFADETAFLPLNKTQCRRQLGLPDDRFLLGTAGALTKNRGISCLTEAFSRSRILRENSILVVAGNRDRHWKPPKQGNFLDLGLLPPHDVPTLFNALDIGIICNLNSDFGRFCYPQKYREMRACGLPVIASNAGVFSSSEQQPGVLATYEPFDSRSLQEAIEAAYLNNPGRVDNDQASPQNEQYNALSEYLASCTSLGNNNVPQKNQY